MKQNYFKSLAIIFFVSVILSLVGCQKGAVEGSTSDSDETHVAGEGNQGIVSEQKSLTAKLTGVVLNDLGSPIENADVYVYDKGTTTNAGGIWVVEDIPVSGVDVTQELDNALFPTIPVTIVADGYTSATVSVQTRAVVSDSAHDGADGDGETDSSSANAPNTVIISGLVGTSGDVVLKRLVNSISGTVRNSINGLPVSMTLTLTPNRDNNYNDAKFPLDEDNDLVYGYQEKTATTDANGNFSFTKIAADTAYDISIATSGWVFKVEPTADELPGAVDLNGDDLNEHPNGNPLTEEVYEEEDDVKTQTKWKVDIKNDEVVTLGTLYVKPVTSSDNINPYVENIANSFESSFLTKKLDNTAYYEEVKWIQLDDTVFYGGNPIEMKFSETMNTDRFDINEVNQKAGNAVSIVVFERASVPVPSWATWKCPAGPVAPKGLEADDNPDCLDRRLFVDETRTTLSGDTLSIYLKDVPKRGYIVDVLLKQTDFIDTAPEQNYLTTPPKDIETYIPNLYKSLDKILVAGDANLHTGHTGGNYWQYRMAGYFEPNLSVVYPRPQVRQITCKTSWNPDIGIIATDKSPEGAIRKLLSDLPFIGNGVLDLWEIVFGPTYKKSGLCDYFGDDVAPIGSDLVQMNADNMPMQQNQDGTVTEKTRLTTLANAYAVAQPDDFPGWDTANVVTDLAFVKLTKDVYTGFKYTLVVMRGNDSVALTAISEQQGIVMDNVGSQVDAEGNKYYLGMVGTEPAEGFYFKASGNGMQIALKGVKKGDKVVITPVENGDGESVIAKGEDNDTSRKVEDLTPPMVAIQSENFDSKLVKASDSLLGTDDVAGEILIQGETGLQYPGLQLTASLYDRTIRRAAENAVKNDVPLLAFSDGKTGLPDGRPDWLRQAHSDHVYTALNFTEWETKNKEATNQFSKTEREIIIEMTEQMEWGLTYEGGAFDLDQFKNKNIEDANPSDTLKAELTGLRSYDSGNAFLVAKLDDWREVKDKSLMTIMGLSDLNNNQVVSNDAGVFFLDRTPPMAKSVDFRVEGNNVVLDVNFDQNLYWDWNVGETMEIMNSDESVKYTVTFGKDTPHTIKGIDYTDAKGRDISKSDEISVKIEGNNTKTLTLTIEGNDDELVTVGDQKINLKSYFDVLSTGAHISWPGIGDYINNRWKTVTAKANETGATAAEQNDAYYCPSAGNCKDPAIVVDDKFKPTLKYKSDLELNCAGYTELVADDESSSKDVKFTCLSITDNKAAINDDGKEYEPDQSSLKVHLIHTVDDEKNQINHWSEPRNFGGGITENLANITMTAEEIADGDVTQDDVNGAWRTIYKNRNRDHIWSMYDDGRDITIDNEKVDRGSESYEIEMSFREPIKCKNDDNQDVTVLNDPCKNIDAGIYSDENLATKISSGDVDTTTYSGVVAKYVDSSTIRISFTLREDKQAAKDHTLALIGIEDKSGQKAGETVGDDDNVVRITLLDGDKGVKIQPATMVY